jgi:ketosteroid isomerase-like protein
MGGLDDVIDRRLVAEHTRDVEAILATCAPDVEQDVAGREPNTIRGHAALREFYREFFADLEYASTTHERRLRGADFALDEAVIEAIAHGRPFDLEGYGRPIRFRILRLFEMRDGLIARESIWADIAAIRRQLAPPVPS